MKWKAKMTALKIPKEPMKWKAKAKEQELDSPLETMWAKDEKQPLSSKHVPEIRTVVAANTSEQEMMSQFASEQS
eukprot:scaffold2153_cov174-Alexandrium_tamarense.AAC.4